MDVVVVAAAAAVSTLAHEPAPSVATKNRKSIIRTTIYCVAMYTKMARSVPADKLAIVPNTNAKWPSLSSERVTWHYFLSLAKSCARL